MLAGACSLWAGQAGATSILSTKHNLSAAGGNHKIGQNEEVCIYCHTPHNGDASLSPQGALLWNRNLDAGNESSYLMYTSPTFQAEMDPAPSGVSRVCLSCHDGTVGINQFLNNAGSGSGINPEAAADAKEGQATLTGAALLGTDLRDDHPVSMQFSTARSANGHYQNSFNNGENDPPGFGNSGFNSPAYIQSRGLKLFEGETGATDYVQCASCHNPHEAVNSTFLRISNTNSALCLTCHNKERSAPHP